MVGGGGHPGRFSKRAFTSSSSSFNATGESAATSKGSVPRFATLLATAAVSFGGYTYLLSDAQRSEAQFLFFSKVSPLMRLMDPETAHNVGIELLARGVSPLETRPDNNTLTVTRWGVTFPNPIGLAAGFDKDAKAFPSLLGAGFGFVEIGSVTPKPQPGNPKPRVFRLQEHGAVINRYGFNSEGHESAKIRLQKYREERPTQFDIESERKQSGKPQSADLDSNSSSKFTPPLGVNLGKNKLTPEAEAYFDYTKGVKELGRTADYLVVNISSPNTPGLRNLQSKKFLKTLMTKVLRERDSLPDGHRPPVLLKIAPDLSDKDVGDIASAALSAKVDGIIVSNTTVARPDFIQKHVNGHEAGGLSGAPLMDASTEMLAKVYKATDGKIPLVGCGGISNGHDAYRKIKAGASLVQLYTAFAYQGPGMLPAMKNELSECLKRDGFASVEDAVGADHRKKK